MTALMMASKYGHVGAVTALLGAGADANLKVRGGEGGARGGVSRWRATAGADTAAVAVAEQCEHPEV